MSKSQITDKLWVGSWRDAKAMLHFNSWGIITTANDAQVIGHEFYPISDPGTDSNDPMRVNRAIKTTMAYLETHDNVLVHCQSGINRSVSVVIGVLMAKYDMSFEDAYQKVFDARKMIEPCRRLLVMACEAVGQKYPETFQRPTPSLDDAEQIVNELYQKVLQRKADPGGLKSYSEHIRSGRMTVPQLEAHLYCSDEYAKKFGHLSSPE